MEREASICCGFTAALLLLYCFTTGQSGDEHGARSDRAHVFVREVQYLVEEYENIGICGLKLLGTTSV